MISGMVKISKDFWVILLFSAIVLFLNIVDISKDKCELTECYVEPSLDAGLYGNLYRVELALSDLDNLRYISVENASFFRVIYSANNVSNWYYSSTFPKQHTTKIERFFEIPNLHEVLLTDVKGPIIVEANVVTNFIGCIEVTLINEQGVSSSRCIKTINHGSSYLLIVLYLLFPIFILWVITVKIKKRKQILIYETCPNWFRDVVDERDIRCIAASKDYWLLCFLPISIYSIFVSDSGLRNYLFPTKTVRSALKNIALLCIRGYLSVHRPKIVITFIDNSAFFLRCAKLNPHIKFLIVQNGFRSAVEIRSVFGDMNTFFTLPNVEYLCYSVQQKKLFETTLGLDEGNILKPFGSTIWKHLCSKNVGMKVTFEDRDKISFVSQWADFHSNDCLTLTREQTAAKQNLVIITKAFRALSEKGINITIILRTNLDAEKSFFKDSINDHIEMVDMSIDRYNSYRAAFSSHILIAMSSSLAIEAELYGVDVLMLNPVGATYFDTSQLVRNYLEGAFEVDIVERILFELSLRQTHAIDIELASEPSLIDLIDYEIES